MITHSPDQLTEFLHTRCRAQTEAQLSIATAFLDRFQLTPAEEKAIKSADVNKEFFEALRHAHKIQDDCNMLLHSKNQRAGYVHAFLMAILLLHYLLFQLGDKRTDDRAHGGRLPQTVPMGAIRMQSSGA